uniref:Uncharacterized protein n=1 Tax=Siphoviridae sp. ctZd434 TaxID=2825559 RepID=A0A8S5UHN4_9CAUD|nr:MAG TPA: hypothetical protein [Siphoviridae sp. ctZd434]
MRGSLEVMSQIIEYHASSLPLNKVRDRKRKRDGL